MATSESDLIAAYAAAVRRRFTADVEREERESAALRAKMLTRLGPAVQEARAATGVKRVWLFGSYAWGQPDAHSDVDLLVEDLTGPDHFAYLVSKACDVMVHAVPLKGAPDALVERVLSEGVLV